MKWLNSVFLLIRAERLLIRLTIAFLCLLNFSSCETKRVYVGQFTFDRKMSAERKAMMAGRVVPDARQLEWQKLELTAFIHFGINTFTGREWGDGTESPELFNPERLDAGQWVTALKDAGIKLVILTAKHHDGFCLWPTKTTMHSVTGSPWRDGEGDVVWELKKACEDADLRFGIYLSPWDRNSPVYGNSPLYNELYIQQLTELLSNYGRIDEVWFDGACGEGPDGKKQEYDWAAYYDLIRRLQPEAVVAIKGEDVRWVGTESGYGRATEWSVTALAPGGRPEMQAINQNLGLDETSADLGSREVLEKAGQVFWFPAEVDVSIRPGWFFHENETPRIKSLPRLADIYFNSVGMNSVLLLNIPPDRRGLIHETDVARLKEFGNWVSSSFRDNLSLQATVIPSGLKALADGDRETYKSMGNTPAYAELTFKEDIVFDVILLQEYIERGQRVEEFTIEVQKEGKWTEVAGGTTIGYKRLLRIQPVRASKVRINIKKSRGDAFIAEAGLFLTSEIISDPVIRRNKDGWVSMSNETPCPHITYTLDGSDPDRESDRYTTPFLLPRKGIVKARAFNRDLSESGNIITETYDACKTNWRIAVAEPSHPAFPAENVIDEDPGSMWHTALEGILPPPPYSVTVDMNDTLSVCGFTYAPRNDGNFSGTALQYEFATSPDGVHWLPQVKGEFANMLNNPSKQTIEFEQTAQVRYFRFTMLKGIYGENWISAAELGIISCGEAFPQ